MGLLSVSRFSELAGVSTAPRRVSPTVVRARSHRRDQFAECRCGTAGMATGCRIPNWRKIPVYTCVTAGTWPIVIDRTTILSPLSERHDDEVAPRENYCEDGRSCARSSWNHAGIQRMLDGGWWRRRWRRDRWWQRRRYLRVDRLHLTARARRPAGNFGSWWAVFLFSPPARTRESSADRPGSSSRYSRCGYAPNPRWH